MGNEISHLLEQDVVSVMLFPNQYWFESQHSPLLPVTKGQGLGYEGARRGWFVLVKVFLIILAALLVCCGPVHLFPRPSLLLDAVRVTLDHLYTTAPTLLYIFEALCFTLCKIVKWCRK